MKEGEISHSTVRNWYFGLRVFQLLYNVIVIVVLIWLRLDWGITNWVYTAQFTNFWSGIYIFFAGSCIGTVESIVGFCALINLSIRLIIVDQVSGLTSLLLQLVGLTCMLTDSLGKPVGWIQDLIRDLIDPAQMNNIMATENFLHNLYRIVECCGARGPDDYLMYDRSPPNACIDRYHAGGIFFKQGCGVGFSTYLKEWSAGLGATVLVGLIVQIAAGVLCYHLIRSIKRKAKSKEQQVGLLQDYDRKPLPAEPTEPVRFGEADELGKQRIQNLKNRTFSPLYDTPPAIVEELRLTQGNNYRNEENTFSNAFRVHSSRQSLGAHDIEHQDGEVFRERETRFSEPRHKDDLLNRQGVTDFRSSTQKIQEQTAGYSTQYLMQDSKVERPSYNSKQETAGQGAGYSTQIPRGSRFGPESDLLDGYQGSISGYGSGLGSDLGSDLSSERDKNWFQRQRFQNAEHGASSIFSQSDYDGHVRIGCKGGSTTWIQPPANHKLAYQSEIRDLIRSYHDLAENADSDSSVQEEDDDVLMADYSTEYEYQGVGGRKNVTFTQDFTNATTSNSNNKAFRSAARRNASFKTAVKSNNIDKSNNYHLSNNIVKEISRSMESIHDGFRSLSRVNSISSSQRSLRSETGSIRSYSSTGGTNNKRLSRSQEILETRFEPSKSNLPKQQRMRPELRSKSATGLNLLARGLKPRNLNRASKGPAFGQRELRR